MRVGLADTSCRVEVTTRAHNERRVVSIRWDVAASTSSRSSPSSPSIAGEIPQNIYRLRAPLRAKTLEVRRLTPEGAASDVRHIVLDIRGSAMRVLEGQSVGVVPPGVDEQGKPHKLRLYSVASSRRGDDGARGTLSLCVKRVVYRDEAGGTEHHGVASHHLCDLRVGDEVSLTGPVGKSFVLPDDERAPLIMVATGTGIAPFRGFLRYVHQERAPRWSAETLLFYGCQRASELSYYDELAALPGRVITACSREQQNEAGARMYVQHRIAEHASEVQALIDRGARVYVCGLKGMEQGVADALGAVTMAALRASRRFLVETY